MKISVIIPLHNAEKTIGECLNAVYNSDYKNYEVIVVDDCSNDVSMDIVKEFPCRVIPLDTNRGAAFARNAGARAAEGVILVFIDTDVILKKNSLALIAGAFESPEINAVNGSFLKDLRYKNFTSQYKNLYIYYYYKTKKHYENVFFTSIAAIRRDIFNEAGGFDTHYKGATAEDVEFGVRLKANGYRLDNIKELEAEHIRYFSFFGHLKRKTTVYIQIIKIQLRRMLESKEKAAGRGISMDADASILLSIPLSYLIVLVFLIELFTSAHFTFSILLSFIFLLVNLGFLNFLRKTKGTAFFIKGYFMTFIERLSVGLGCLIGLVTFITGEKY